MKVALVSRRIRTWQEQPCLDSPALALVLGPRVWQQVLANLRQVRAQEQAADRVLHSARHLNLEDGQNGGTSRHAMLRRTKSLSTSFAAPSLDLM